MAFKYLVNGEAETYLDDFHFWYVNGFHPDPKLKEETEETKKEGRWPEVVYSGGAGLESRGRMRSWLR